MRPLAAGAGPVVFRAAGLAHEMSVVVLLVGVGFGKLFHVFVRPLQIAVRLVNDAALPRAACAHCGAATAPLAQLKAIEATLEDRGVRMASRIPLCSACRRRSLAAAHAAALGARFQPQPMRAADPQSVPRTKAA